MDEDNNNLQINISKIDQEKRAIEYIEELKQNFVAFNFIFE